ncbi:MAG: undecaprenyl-diphosphate phosphatase [Gammaproteobacteria bacterium]|nr:undecaprenyl-diphosphate phosphatase [Gammaproteobacteria bacterium]
MDIVQVIVLAIVQGLTEFLPISSSAHLILIPKLAGWPDQGLAFDVAVHLGSLIAVVTYFRNDIVQLWQGWWQSLTLRKHSLYSRLAWGIIVATLPILIVGLVFNDAISTYLRSPLVIAATTIGFGLLLWYGDRVGSNQRTESAITWRDIIIIGLAQTLALIPGTSRSGITLTVGLLLGLTRETAARFAFLLSIPTIVAAGSLQTVKLIGNDSASVDWSGMLLGTVLSAIAAYFCIHYFLKLIGSIGLMPFVVYRLALGLLLFILFI